MRPARRERRPALSREAIVAAAIELADTDGLDAVSIRRVAARLEARPMTLYSHIGRKDDLLDLMMDEVAGESVPAGELPDDWRDALRAIAHSTREACLRHPWMTGLAGRRFSFGPNALRHAEVSLAAVAGLDVDRERKVGILLAVDTYTIGQVIRELGDHEAAWRENVSETSRQEANRAYLRGAVASGDFPYLADFGPEILTESIPLRDHRFDEGLDWLIAGIHATVRPD